MKLAIYTDTHPDYLNRSGYIRTMLGEILEQRGHAVLYNPTWVPPDCDFIIATEPSNYPIVRQWYEKTHIPTLVICHDIPLDEIYHPRFEETFNNIFRVIAISKTTYNAVREKWGIRNMDWLYFGFDDWVLDHTVCRAFKDHVIVFGDDAPHRKVQEGISIAQKAGEKVFRVNGQDDWWKAIYLKAALCLVHANEYGGFNIPPMEALYCGIPVVLKDTPVHREFYDNIPSVFFYKTEDEAVEFVRQIRKQYPNTDPGRELAQKFTRNAIGDRLEEYLYKLKSCVDGTVYTHKYLEGKEQTFSGKKIGYDKSYMEYRDDPIWRTLAEEIRAYTKPNRVLDFGCAEGFLVQNLNDIGVASYGVDPALVVETDTLKKTLGAVPGQFDLIYSTEVLEHIYEHKIPEFLAQLKARLVRGGVIVATICLFDNNDFTHITLKPREWWHQKFQEAGFLHRPDLEKRFVDNRLRKQWEYFCYAN